MIQDRDAARHEEVLARLDANKRLLEHTLNLTLMSHGAIQVLLDVVAGLVARGSGRPCGEEFDATQKELAEDAARIYNELLEEHRRYMPESVPPPDIRDDSTPNV